MASKIYYLFPLFFVICFCCNGFGLADVTANLIILFGTQSSYDGILVYCLTSILLSVIIA